jgi:hypothetical protein
VLGNLVLLWGVGARDWRAFVLLPLFWGENVIAGFFHALRIAAAADGGRPFSQIYWPDVIFFCVHYGFFLLGHAIFVFTIALDMFAKVKGPDTSTGLSAWLREVGGDLWIPLTIFALTYAVGFLMHMGEAGAFQSEDTWDLRKGPYGRLVVLQVGLIAGAGLSALFQNPTAILFGLVICKIAFETLVYLSLNGMLPARFNV